MIGKQLTIHFKDKILHNKVRGKELLAKTIDRKTQRGSSSPSTKLRESGALAKQFMYKMDGANVVKMGWNGNEEHKKFKSYDTSVDVSYLAEIHHKGKGNNPERVIIEFKQPERDIIKNEIRKKIVG